MQFEHILREQISLHPSTEPQDVMKLCYQAAFGAEHLLEDLEAAEKYFMREYEQVQPTKEPLYEQIGNDIVRVNMGAWKERKLPPKWLFRMFAETASRPLEGGKELFDACIREAGRLAAEGACGFDCAAWEGFLRRYPLAEPVPVHHSEGYRRMEMPAYRLVCARYLKALPLLELICGKERGSGDIPWGGCVVAIDGRCASGKTTLATQLALITGGSVVHMDDFFLPAKLRVEERLREPGGNVHHERFIEEVLPALKRGQDFTYRCFDCKKMELGEERLVRGQGLIVVEGAYSCHPKFGDYMTVRVFCDVDSEEQLRRVAVRDGEACVETFRHRWIPMEEAYFKAYSIRERADIIM